VPWLQRTIMLTYGQIVSAFVAFQVCGVIWDVLKWSWK
jgi:hypothetical protein